MYPYRICNLYLSSTIPFSLPIARGKSGKIPDIRFTLNLSNSRADVPMNHPIGIIKNGAGHPTITVYQTNGGFILDCNNGYKRIQFAMAADGRWIECYPYEGATREDIELWLFGLILAFVLQNRRIYTLHGAAVNTKYGAIAFLGMNGYGKTTLAYFFLKQGASLITDDVLPIVQKKNATFALPACPSMNLWSETMFAFSAVNRKKSQAREGKHRYSAQSLDVRFCRSKVPLRTIYLLDPAAEESCEAVEIGPVPRARAIIDLLAYTRANSMIGLLEQKELIKTYATLLENVPVRSLRYPRGLEFLPQIYNAICADNSGAAEGEARYSV
jgi:hypothetical protein